MTNRRLISFLALIAANLLIISSLGQFDSGRDIVMSKSVMGKEVMGKEVMGKEVMSPTSPAPFKYQTKNIIDTLKDKGSLDIFIANLEKSGLENVLSSKGPYTVFAPRDWAFDRLDASSKERLSSDANILTKLLKYHIAEGNLSQADLENLSSIETLSGENLSVSSNPISGLEIGGIQVWDYEICTNGMVYFLNDLLVPEELKNQIKEEVIVLNTSTNTAPVSGPAKPNVKTGNAPPPYLRPTQMPIQSQQSNWLGPATDVSQSPSGMYN